MSTVLVTFLNVPQVNADNTSDVCNRENYKVVFCLPHKMTQQHLVAASLDALFSKNIYNITNAAKLHRSPSTDT